jgi:ATP-binding cassette subfamily F protein uup
VSHDRDFLDQTVTKILAFEGHGEIDGVIGGYSDYLEKVKDKKAEEEKDVARKKDAKKTQEPEPQKSPAKKLSFKLQHELDTLPARMEEMQMSIEHLTNMLADADFYARDPQNFLKVSSELEKLKTDLADAEIRWLELDALREAI